MVKNRKGIKITYRNLMITMLLGGLWHGSSWNFIIWGGIHGLVLSVEKFVKSKPQFRFLDKIVFLGYPITFIVVLLAWIFFRAPTFDAAITAFQKIVFFKPGMPFIGDINVLANSLFVLTIGLCFDYFLLRTKTPLEKFGTNFSVAKISIISSILILIINLFYSSSINFIYFQF